MNTAGTVARPSPTARPARAPAEPHGLIALLSDLIVAHEDLLGATHAHREAMRRADPEGLMVTRERMAHACDCIAALDQRRRAVTESIAPGHPEATLTFLATLIDEPARGRALELAARLRELIVQARTDQRRVRAAADSLLRHVRGIVHQIRRSLNHAGTYGQGGRVDPGAAVVSGIDMTT